jgi:Bifunctional DNA primase/polymerase, N-terminal
MFPQYDKNPTSLVGSRERFSTLRVSTDSSPLTRRRAIIRTALEARRAGISVVPVLPDGRKRPAVRWRIYQHRLATPREIARWFGNGERGLALITGAISGGLEALDFDSLTMYEEWSERMRQWGYGALYDRLTCGYLEATPHGVHLLYRSCPAEKNQKLASVPVDGSQRVRTLIETRGEGGLVVVAPSGGRVHPSGKPYVLLAGGITTIPTLTAEERRLPFSVARSFDQTTPGHVLSDVRQQVRTALAQGERPGDRYNRRASWAEVLEPHGWRMLSTRDGESYWQRPGKQDSGVSATTNYQGSDLLYVFSTSTVFEAGKAYSKFAAYAILEHGGDFRAAACALAACGETRDDTAGGSDAVR